MKIVIAPDSFKESLSAPDVAQCIENGFRKVFPEATYIKLPLADGGEGTVDALVKGLNGKIEQVQVSDPLGRPIVAHWGLIDNGNTAVIEVASASGLEKLPPDERNPEITSSFGTGELICKALDLGVKKLIIGLGGSATNDGGAGLLQALGGILKDKQHNLLKRGGAALSELAYIDLQTLHPHCHNVEVFVACDVTNPLCGKNGASHIFGGQKGGDEQQLVALDQALQHFAKVATPLLNENVETKTSFGAAGGMLVGLSLVFKNIHITSGINLVLDALHASQHLADADLLITGEGRMDNQTAQGKTPLGVALLAKQYNVPTIAIAGSLTHKGSEMNSVFNALFDSVRAPEPLEVILKEAATNVEFTALQVASALKLGQQLK